MSRQWKHLERWFWPLFLLSPFIGGALLLSPTSSLFYCNLFGLHKNLVRTVLDTPAQVGSEQG